MQQYLPWLVTALALLVVVALLAWQHLRSAAQQRKADPKPLPTAWDLLPRPVFSADERRLYRQLREALPHHVVLAKLPLVRFCQPSDPNRVRYWYEVLGASHVNFAVCSVNGRVLAAIDLNYERSGPASRVTRIKQSVLGACRIRYLRCAPDHLPSVPELQLLVPQASTGSRGPLPAPGPSHPPHPPAPAAAGRPAPLTLTPGAARRREQTPLWREAIEYKDSFFQAGERRFDANDLVDGLDELPDTRGTGPAGPPAGPAAVRH